jgi:hypothetical protein
MKRRISINSGSVVPQSFITKSKQRLKQHVDTVFLNNGEEFEIELFNPTQNKVLAKIELNGNSIGSGIILRPGERVFLERYLDDAKKFLFETYTVNGENGDVLNAIKNNGDVTVKFYRELSPLRDYPWITNTLFNGVNNTSNGGYVNPTTTQIGGNTYYSQSLSFSKDIFIPSTVSMSTNSNEKTLNLTSSLKSREIETGRVEKGSDSNQSFSYDYSSFESQPSWSNWWKLKPNSQKPLVKEDLVTYCTECGSKRKKDNHKFCPHCGTKF